MSPSYAIVVEAGRQTGSEHSFVGGQPKLPASAQVPYCSLCSASQTFFFQLAFPADHAWTGTSLAVFACTTCADENHLIPEMLTGPLPGAQVSAAFLAAYQRNFRLMVFKTNTAETLATYVERVRFRPLRLIAGMDSSFGRVGGKPHWILEDETPGSIASMDSVVFLMQLSADIMFDTLAAAPAQMEIGLAGNGEPSPDDFYRLFIGNTVYMFGPTIPTEDSVYALTQVP